MKDEKGSTSLDRPTIARGQAERAMSAHSGAAVMAEKQAERSRRGEESGGGEGETHTHSLNARVSEGELDGWGTGL